MDKMPPKRFVTEGLYENNEEWKEYKLSDQSYSKQSQTPVIMHPVQIKAHLINQYCPVIMALHRWFTIDRWTIVEDSIRIGRFIQSAYN